jgi:Omp85 superfamily domain
VGRASFLLAQRSDFQLRYPRPKADRAWNDLSLLLLSAFFWTLLATFAQARELQSGEVTTGGQTSSSQNNPAPKELPSDPKAPAQHTPVERKHDGQESFIVAPLPISSPALGTGIVPVFAYIFHLSSHDKTSPPSVIGGAGLVTNNGSRAFVLAGDLFFHENTYHATAAYAHGNLNYDLYGVGIDAGKAGIRLPLNQTGQFFFAEFSRRVGWKLFLGTRVFMGESTITVRPSDGSTIPPPPDVGLRTNLRSLGFRLQRDTRPNRFYPTTGTFLDFTADFFSQGLGSKYSYQSYKFTFNKFASLSQKQVLAFDLSFCGTGGKPPFYGNCIYGTNNRLRGYKAGRYLDRYMLVTQLEYRLVLPKRFGLVGFGGIGGVAPGGDQLFSANHFLPSAGGGIRFLLSKKYHVNLRADAGFGKDGHTWSMGVAEAF